MSPNQVKKFVTVTIYRQSISNSGSGNELKRQRMNKGKRERGKNYTKQPSNVTAILHRWSRSSHLLVKSGNNVMSHVPVFELEACNRLKKKGGCCYSKLKGICSKKAALKEGIQLIVFGFVFQVLTSIPLKFWKFTPTERRVRSNSRVFVNAIPTLCAQKKSTSSFLISGSLS